MQPPPDDPTFQSRATSVACVDVGYRIDDWARRESRGLVPEIGFLGGAELFQADRPKSGRCANHDEALRFDV